MFRPDPGSSTGLCPESFNISSDYGSSSFSWSGISEQFNYEIDNIQQQYHQNSMAINPSYADQYIYSGSLEEYNRSFVDNVTYASGSVNYAPSSVNIVSSFSGPSYQAFDTARYNWQAGRYGAAIGWAIHEVGGRISGFSDLNAFTSGYDPYTGSVSGSARLMKGVSGISQVAMYGFAGGMPALKTASAIASAVPKAINTANSATLAASQYAGAWADVGGYYANNAVRGAAAWTRSSAVSSYNWAAYSQKGQAMTRFMQSAIPASFPGQPPSVPPIILPHPQNLWVDSGSGNPPIV